MKYKNAKAHDFIALLGDPNFCDECGINAPEHRTPSCILIKRWGIKERWEIGQIVQRKKDRRYFFEIRQWNGHEWHPLTVGYQTGFFADAQDRFESWKRMQETWFGDAAYAKLGPRQLDEIADDQ